ncbi:hypothetical protein ABPG72_001525 [Tetrahymena utriculariae]
MMSQDFQVQNNALALGGAFVGSHFALNPAQLAFPHQIKPTLNMNCNQQITDSSFSQQHCQSSIQQQQQMHQQQQQQQQQLQQQHLIQQIQQHQQIQQQQQQKQKQIQLSLQQPSAIQTQQLFSQQSQTLTVPASSPYAKQNINNCCNNEFCNLGFQTQMRPQDKNRFIEQARSQGVGIVCVNCAQHDIKQIIERVKQDGDIFVLFNSCKINSLSNDNSYTTIPNDQNDNLTMLNSANNSSTTQQNQIPSLPNIPQTGLTGLSSVPTLNTIYPVTQNVLQFQKRPTFNFPQPNVPIFSSNESLMKEYSNQPGSALLPQVGLPFQQAIQSQHALSFPMFLNHQDPSLKLLPAGQGQYIPQFNFAAGYPLHNQNLLGEGKSTLVEEKSSRAPLPKIKNALFKKTSSSSIKNQSSKDFKVKVEGGLENSSSKLSSNDMSEENESADSFSENLANNNNNQLSGQQGSEIRNSKTLSQRGSNSAIPTKASRKSTENNTNMTPEEIEKQNKIKERRKTNNFGHIYTWLKNQIRLYYGDRELYEQIQTYFQRVNKYNEIVTDESSSKWQFFLYQIKDNTNLKSFLKEKIKSEHFREYIKTRKGKDQKVFYEFRIGVIYGIDHPELSNQPKNCLLMAKKDPEYCNINFGW